VIWNDIMGEMNVNGDINEMYQNNSNYSQESHLWNGTRVKWKPYNKRKILVWIFNF